MLFGSRVLLVFICGSRDVFLGHQAHVNKSLIDVNLFNICKLRWTRELFMCFYLVNWIILIGHPCFIDNKFILSIMVYLRWLAMERMFTIDFIVGFTFYFVFIWAPVETSLILFVIAGMMMPGIDLRLSEAHFICQVATIIGDGRESVSLHGRIVVAHATASRMHQSIVTSLLVTLWHTD